MSLNKLTFSVFLLLVFSLGFMIPFVTFQGKKVPLTDFVFLIVFSLWIISLLLKKRKFIFDKSFYFIVFYTFAAFTSAIFAPRTAKSLVSLSGVIYLTALPILTVNLIENANDFRKTLYAWLAGTFCACLVGFAAFISFYATPQNEFFEFAIYHYGAVPVGNYPRLASTFVSASMFCNYLSASLLLVFIADKSGWIGQKTFLFFYFAIIFCAIFTISAGLGGLFFSLGIWVCFLFKNRQKNFARFSLVSAIFTALLFIYPNIIALQKHETAPFSFILFGKEFYPSPRLLIWSESFQTFKENPLFGKGLGEDSCFVKFENTEGGYSVLTDAHNVILSVASQSGLPGLAAILLIFYFILTRKTDNYVSLGIWLALISTLIYQGLTGSFEDARHVWVLLGLFISSGLIFSQKK